MRFFSRAAVQAQTRVSMRELVIFCMVIIMLVINIFFVGEWNMWLVSSLMLLVFLIGFLLMRSPAMFVIARERPVIFYAAFIVIALVTVFFSSYLYASVSRLALYLAYGAIMLIGGILGSNELYRRALVWIATLLGMIVGAATITIALVQADIRAEGFLGNANVLGGYLIITLPLSAWIFFSSRRFAKVFGACAMILVSFALLLSLSYTGLASILFIAMLFSFVYARRVYTWRRARIGLAVCVSILVLFAGIRYVMTRDAVNAVALYRAISFEGVAQSFRQRYAFNEAALRMTADRPLTGYGLGAYQEIYPRYAVTVIEQPRYVHNLYLEHFAETGILGGAAFLAVVYLVIRQMALYLRRGERTQSYWLICAISVAILAGFVHAGLDFALNFPSVGVLLWLLVGMLIGAISMHGRSGQETTGSVRGRMVSSVALWIALLVLLARGVTLALAANSVQQATLARDRGEQIAAMEGFSRASTFDPDPVSLREVGWADLNSQKDAKTFPRAHETVIQALAWNATDYFAYHLQGRIFYREGNLDEARRSLEHAVKLDPWLHPNFQYDLAVVYQELGRDTDALLLVDVTLARYGTSITSTSNPRLEDQLAHLALLGGTIYQSRGNLKRARQYYEQALVYELKFAPAQKAIEEIDGIGSKDL